MNTLVYEGTVIYWIAVKDGDTYVGHGVLDTHPSVVSSKWNLEAYTDESVWRNRLLNDFGVDPDIEEEP